MNLPQMGVWVVEKKRVTLFFWNKSGKDINLLARTCRKCGKDMCFVIFENDIATLSNDLATQKMTLPWRLWQDHYFVWQGHVKVWQGHEFGVWFWPSPETCHGIKNDLTHQKNVFATQKNDFATYLVARSFICVAKSYYKEANTWIIYDIAIQKNDFAINLSKKPLYLRRIPVKCACVCVCSGGG